MPQPTEITQFIFGQPLRQIMRAVETGSSVGSSYVDALAYAVSSCVTEPSWRRGVRHGAGQPASASPAHAKIPRGASEQHSGRSAMGCPHTWMGGRTR